jgi:hypothetical protein
MAKRNYVDCIDDCLGFVAATRMADFVPFMVEQHKSNQRKLGEQHGVAPAFGLGNDVLCKQPGYAVHHGFQWQCVRC